MKPAPRGWPRLSTTLFYQDAHRAIEWLSKAFGFEVRLKIEGEGGLIEHSELVFAESVIMVGDARRIKDFGPRLVSPLSAGNVHRNSLSQLYRSSDLFLELRDAEAPQGRCGRCEFRVVCGGSRPRAFGATRNLLADDPLCGYAPGSFGHADRVEEAIAWGAGAAVDSAASTRPVPVGRG